MKKTDSGVKKLFGDGLIARAPVKATTDRTAEWGNRTEQVVTGVKVFGHWMWI